MTLDELRARARIDRGGYRVFDGEFAQMAVTLEDAEFLYALVRLVKPRRVLELGTGLGVSARFIAEALAANGNDGMLMTVEHSEEHLGAAADLLQDLPVTLLGDPSRSIGRDDGQTDLVFIDSGWAHRAGDLAEWLTNGYQGLVVVHDAGRGYKELGLGRGVFLPGSDGLWVGRGAQWVNALVSAMSQP